MKHMVTVREYAQLTTQKVEPSLDRAQVSRTAFDWLCQLSASFSKSGATLLQVEGTQSLKWDSYVGVVETPCGTRLEILPKHVEFGDCETKSRVLLRKMIQSALDIRPREVGVAGLELFNAPISEWVMGQFLIALDILIKRGIRFDYQRIEEEQRFLRGQLNIVAQMHQPPGRQHYFQIRHDVFLPDRPENRLIKLALEQVCKSTQNADNWRLAHELRSLMSEVPKSQQVYSDFRKWGTDRLMAHYQHIKPWCELILKNQMPLAVAGTRQGISLLFPMEKLFERYVEAWLRSSLQSSATLKTQAASQFLCEHDEGNIFRLEPDFLVQQGDLRWVLDAKWKRIDASNRKDKYGLSQGDFYQLFAYGQKYLQGKGEMLLIYPKWSKFQAALPVFDFGGGLTLRALPFDLENEVLIDVGLSGLPARKEEARLDPAIEKVKKVFECRT